MKKWPCIESGYGTLIVWPGIEVGEPDIGLSSLVGYRDGSLRPQSRSGSSPAMAVAEPSLSPLRIQFSSLSRIVSMRRESCEFRVRHST